MISKKELISMRPGTLDDHSFIYATWLKGLYYGNPWFRAIDQEAYFKNYHKFLEMLLAKKDLAVSVVCLKESPEVILGYSVSSPGVLHWVFVKSAWRKIGLAKQLIPDDIQWISHLTEQGKKFAPKSWRFNPFIER